MTSLFDKNRHESLTKREWNIDEAVHEINQIIHDFSSDFDSNNKCWPTHPLDAASYSRKGPKWCLYGGAAGAVVGLNILRKEGYSAPDFSDQLQNIYSSYLKDPDVNPELGLQLGEIGILTPIVLSNPENEELSNRLVQCMKQIIGHQAREITSGETGMMHAALALHQATGQEKWKEHFVKGAESLWSSWEYHTDCGRWLWTNDIFGYTRRHYGACHGIVGNANVFFKGADLIPVDHNEVIIERVATALKSSALRASNMANWHAGASPNEGLLLVQWCHGAPGIATALVSAPEVGTKSSEILSQLILEAGRLTWFAGPLKKGSGVCHGTAGNGYAFLSLFKRTGDQQWLDYARQFAMHAIEQCQIERKKHGQSRYTLWTGDAGLAIYLHHCIYPDKAAIPGLDIF